MWTSAPSTEKPAMAYKSTLRLCYYVNNIVRLSGLYKIRIWTETALAAKLPSNTDKHRIPLSTFIVKSLKTVSSEFWNEVIERDAYAVSYQV